MFDESLVNFALSLEHLESRLYQTVMAVQGLIPAKDKQGFTRDQKIAHVKFLRDVITKSRGTPVAESNMILRQKILLQLYFLIINIF